MRSHLVLFRLLFSPFFLRQMCPFSQVHSILGPINCCVVRQLNTYFGDFVNFLPWEYYICKARKKALLLSSYIENVAPLRHYIHRLTQFCPFCSINLFNVHYFIKVQIIETHLCITKQWSWLKMKQTWQNTNTFYRQTMSVYQLKCSTLPIDSQ